MAKERGPVLLLDAGAIDAMGRHGLDGNAGSSDAQPCACIVTPHAAEMAKLLKIDKCDVEANACEVATRFARSRNTVVALKGAKTFIADPDGSVWLHDRGNASLAVPGSGDCLAGIVAALAARGATPAQAAVWGVALHGLAGAALAAQYGPLGALARELPRRIPALMNKRGADPDRDIMTRQEVPSRSEKSRIRRCESAAHTDRSTTVTFVETAVLRCAQRSATSSQWSTRSRSYPIRSFLHSSLCKLFR